jgi:hypothetical protein
MRIDTQKINNWNQATKTKPIKAKLLSNILIDRTVIGKFLLETIEGKEPLQDNTIICLGELGDVWQQTPEKLLKKYTIISIDCNGWWICNPLPDNVVNCVEATGDFTAMGKFSIIGHYGEVVDGIPNVQNGKQGDFICQNCNDFTDVWIVNRKIFLNTYSIKNDL